MLTCAHHPTLCFPIRCSRSPSPHLCSPAPCCAPIHSSCPHYFSFVRPTHSWSVFIPACSTLCAFSVHLLLPFLLWLPLGIHAPLHCLCMFMLIQPHVRSVCAHSPLFAPAVSRPFLLPLLLHIHAPSIHACLTSCALSLCPFTFVCACCQQAIPAAVAAVHTCALMLALGLCVPAIYMFLQFVALYL